jgi:hypothetical protein
VMLLALGFLVVSLAWLFAVHPSPKSFGGTLKAVWRIDTPPLGEALALGGFALGAALLIWLRLSERLRPGAFVTLALLLAGADLFRAGVGLNPAIPRAHATQPTTPAVRYLQSRRPNRFVGLGSGPLPSLGVTTFPYSLSLRYGIYDARGYNAPLVGRYQRFWSQKIFPSYYLFSPVVELTPQTLGALNLLSVSDIVLRSPFSKGPTLPGLRIAYGGRDARIYSNSNALPRTFVVDGERAVGSADDALVAISTKGFDPRRYAVTESIHPGLKSESETPDAPAGNATLASYTADKVVVRASAGQPSLVVLTDVYYPGWKATVDGKSASVDPVDYVLRGVPIPAGDHTVTFRYEPSSWKLAKLLSVLGVVALALTALVGVLRLRRR